MIVPNKSPWGGAVGADWGQHGKSASFQADMRLQAKSRSAIAIEASQSKGVGGVVGVGEVGGVGEVAGGTLS